MTALKPQRRSVTAKEGAARLGVTPRTVQRIMAEPRAEFENRAQQRRAQAQALRDEGKKYKEIADIMQISIGAVGALLHEVRKKQQVNKAHKRPPQSK